MQHLSWKQLQQKYRRRPLRGGVSSEHHREGGLRVRAVRITRIPKYSFSQITFSDFFQMHEKVRNHMRLLSDRPINRGQKYATFFQNASKPRTPGSMMRQSYSGAPSLIRGAGCHHWTGGAGDRKKLENHEVKKSCILLSSMDGNWWKSFKMFLKKLEIVEKSFRGNNCVDHR